MTDQWTIRPIDPAKDLSFVFATWTQGSHGSCACTRAIYKPTYYTHQNKRCQQIMHDLNTRVLIACLPDDKDVILGYIVYQLDPHWIHWVHVKAPFQGNGIARSLWAASELPEGCWTSAWHHSVSDLIKRLKLMYSPYV